MTSFHIFVNASYLADKYNLGFIFQRQEQQQRQISSAPFARPRVVALYTQNKTGTMPCR